MPHTSIITTDLTSAESPAKVIQHAVDSLAPAGGTVELPAGEYELDRGIRLGSRVSLVGQGAATRLLKAPGRVYPLSGYHNYGMHDVPLVHTVGLRPGMTVAIRDRVHGGFSETFARITWVEDNWVGLDRGLCSDYAADQHPELVTAFPLIYAEDAVDVTVADITLDGQREIQPAGIGSCRGAAIYFIRCARFAVRDVVERGFRGEGLGFQMCRDARIERCRFDDNLGNGLHPGAGSTGALFSECHAEGNGRSGFFFCVRANHITVRDCTFARNAEHGISIGTRDCHNTIERCRCEGNAGPGVYARPASRPVEVHSIVLRDCALLGNAHDAAKSPLGGQIELAGDAHDIAITGNRIVGGGSGPGIAVGAAAERVWLAGNAIKGCSPAIIADRSRLATKEPALDVGHETVIADHYRHLALPDCEDDGCI